MQLSRVGEFGLIRRITGRLRLDPSVVKGPGDDCAVLRFDRRHYLLFTCDMIAEGVDFPRGQDPFLVGRKAVAVSVSDIAACGGLPRHCVVSLGLPRATKTAYVDGLCAGIKSICNKFGINLVGGDISAARQLVLDVSMLGLVEKKRLVLRSGAQPGDVLCVSGRLGGSILGRHLRFTPRLSEARYLVTRFKIHAMIDVSDGLVQDLGHILAASRAGAVLYEPLIPRSRACRGLDDALYSGEDFELLFCLSRSQAGALFAQKPGLFHRIGEITASARSITLVDRYGCQRPLRPGGYTHF